MPRVRHEGRYRRVGRVVSCLSMGRDRPQDAAMGRHPQGDSRRAPRMSQKKKKPKPAACKWTQTEEFWGGTCGVKWVLSDGRPAENEMHYCPRCGARLVT